MSTINYTPFDVIKTLSEQDSSTGGTSLITFYVPNSNNTSILKKLTSELSTSQNIKDKSVRTSVRSALKSSIEKIKSFKTTNLNNGYVLCAGELKSYV